MIYYVVTVHFIVETWVFAVFNCCKIECRMVCGAGLVYGGPNKAQRNSASCTRVLPFLFYFFQRRDEKKNVYTYSGDNSTWSLVGGGREVHVLFFLGGGFGAHVFQRPSSITYRLIFRGSSALTVQHPVPKNGTESTLLCSAVPHSNLTSTPLYCTHKLNYKLRLPKNQLNISLSQQRTYSRKYCLVYNVTIL